MLFRSGSHLYWWALWSLLGIVYAFVSLSLWTSGVSSLFTASRGLALAITLCGTAISTMLAPLTTVFFLEHYGWRNAYLGNAILWGVLILPLIYLFFTSASDRNRTAPAAKADETAAKPQTPLARTFPPSRAPLLEKAEMPAPAAPAPKAEPAPQLKVEAPARPAPAAREDDLLEIPAFLRRQTN